MSELANSVPLPLEQDKAVASTQPPCSLNDLPQAAHQYIHALVARVEKLETDAAEQRARLIAMGQKIFSMPQTKMMLAAFPKEMQKQIKGFFGESNAVTENNGNR